MSPITAGTNPELKKEKAATAKGVKPASKTKAPKPEKAPEKKIIEKGLKKAPKPSLDFLRQGGVEKALPKAPAVSLDFLKPAEPAKGMAKAPKPDLKAPTRAPATPKQDRDLTRKR